MDQPLCWCWFMSTFPSEIWVLVNGFAHLKCWVGKKTWFKFHQEVSSRWCYWFSKQHSLRWVDQSKMTLKMLNDQEVGQFSWHLSFDDTLMLSLLGSVAIVNIGNLNHFFLYVLCVFPDPSKTEVSGVDWDFGNYKKECCQNEYFDVRKVEKRTDVVIFWCSYSCWSYSFEFSPWGNTTDK